MNGDGMIDGAQLKKGRKRESKESEREERH